VCISDTHSAVDPLTKLPEGDVLVHAGDFSRVGRPEEIANFVHFLNAQPHPYKVVIAGNHDLTLEQATFARTSSRLWYGRAADALGVDCGALKRAIESSCTYLEDSSVAIEGVNFYGSPWSPRFCDWAFNADRGEEICEIWKRIPTNTDVLVTHGPPIGYGDECFNGFRAGCVDLLREIETRVRPRVHVYGHVHEGYGVRTNGETLFINASTCTLRYRPTNAPVIVDVPISDAVPL